MTNNEKEIICRQLMVIHNRCQQGRHNRKSYDAGSWESLTLFVFYSGYSLNGDYDEQGKLIGVRIEGNGRDD